ncbi:MAG TPA: erythromycin esterase family protein, partial [Kofleriaceae bacterium]|nr:erythromycin esterase family protein [Kofleriaceae bacterium]
MPTRVHGIVRDTAGAPVAGATVAAVEETAAVAAAVVTSGADGRFQLTVPWGRYALTATAPGHVAGYRPVEPWAGAPEVSVSLGGPGFTLSGRVKSAAPLPAGTNLVVFRYSDVQGDIFYAPLDGTGRFAVQLPPATYALTISARSFLAPPTRAELTRDRAVDLSVRRLDPAPDEVVAWIRRSGIPLSGVEAGAGTADMAPLAASIGRARVVALGEATHGTREFFQMKHRMFEYLVSERGFTVFAIEANWPESLAVNRYVLTGEGDPKAALAGLYFWTWNTEEVLALIEWMRAWNADPAHARKVKFFGFDMQFS